MQQQQKIYSDSNRLNNLSNKPMKKKSIITNTSVNMMNTTTHLKPNGSFSFESSDSAVARLLVNFVALAKQLCICMNPSDQTMWSILTI